MLLSCGPATPEPASEAQAAPAVLDADQARVFEVLNAERSARSLRAVDRVEEPRPLTTAAEMIRNGAPPEVALRTALGRLVEAESSEGRGWCVPTESLSEPQFPSVIVEREELTLAVVVVRMPTASGATAPAAPFVVCYLIVEDGQDPRDG